MDASAEDASQDDVQPTTRLISKIQAIELLAKLVQFLPKQYSKDSAVAESNASAEKNGEFGDIRILSQFKLRYLCRRFRNIIHWQTPLTLLFDRDGSGNYRVSLAENGIGVSRKRSLNQLAELPKRVYSACEDPSVRKAVLITDGICCVEIERSYSSLMQPEHTLFMPALLCRLTEAAQGPCCLSLDLTASRWDDLQDPIKDFNVPLKCQFPSLALAELRLRGDGFYMAARPLSLLTKHLLEFGQDSLVKLHVSIYVLKSAFVAENGRMAVLSDAWTCESLAELKLCIGDHEYRNIDNDDRVALVAFCARLPRIFPGLKRIVFHGENRHFDFFTMHEFERLVSVKLSSFFDRGYPTQEQCESLALLSATGVSSLTLVGMEALLLKVDLALPKLTTFKYEISQITDSFAALKRQLETGNGSFAHLRELVLTLHAEQFPSYAEFLQLLRSLHALRELTTFRLQFEEEYPDWCSPGDFSVIQVLPETITKAYFIFALRPTAVEFDDDTWKYSLRCFAEVPRGEEWNYTHWLRTLLVCVAERPRLERFFCVVVAPRFDAILALAEKWNKSSVAAIAELKLTFVVHVQCTPVYARMLETGISARGDRMRFRFVLEQGQNLAPGPADKLAKLQRRMVTVEFKNVA